MIYISDVELSEPIKHKLQKKFIKDSPDKCWPWRGQKNQNGYGTIVINGGTKAAHRLVFRMLAREIGKELVLDHLCNNKACVNPSHLLPTTNKENIMRGVGFYATNARKKICKNGHHFIKAMTAKRGPGRPRKEEQTEDKNDTVYLRPDGSRECKICRRIYLRNFRKRKKQRA